MPSLEFFWGVEVKPGQTVSCDPGKGCILRLSQAALGETKKGSGIIVISAKIDDQKVIVGTLSAENHPQFRCDMIFHKKIELSHSSESASVFLCGYRAVMPDQPDKDEGQVKTVNHQVIEDDSDSSSLDDLSSSEDDSSSSKDDTSEGDDNSTEEDDSSSEEDDGSSEEDDSGSEEIDTSSEEIATSSEEDSSDEEDKNTPKKTEGDKKRVAETALKTASDKKAKIATPSSKTPGDKKVPHVATPHPAEQASRAPGNSDSKPKAKSPKFRGTHARK